AAPPPPGRRGVPRPRSRPLLAHRRTRRHLAEPHRDHGSTRAGPEGRSARLRRIMAKTENLPQPTVRTVEDRIEELRKRRAALLDGARRDAVRKQHEKGKLTARERVELLGDRDSFQATDPFPAPRSHAFGIERNRPAGDGVITGYGTVDGRGVFVASQDFTVFGGSLGEIHGQKMWRVRDLAMSTGAPFIQINDSGGARIQEGAASLAGYG